MKTPPTCKTGVRPRCYPVEILVTSRCSLAAILLIAMTTLGCNRESERLPTELLQVWRTSAPEYRHKHLELRERYVIFGLDELSISMNPIDRVESKPGLGGRVEYLIEYHDFDDEAFEIRLLYRSNPEPELQLANHTEIWKPARKVNGGS